MPWKINAAWHAENRMPKNATRDQRIDWHLRHSEACGCRPAPDSLRNEIAKRAAGKA
jgi:hypothetical protein